MATPQDSPVQPVAPVAPVAGVRAVQPSEAEPAHAVREETRPRPASAAAKASEQAAAATSGGIPAAYAQFVVDPDTHQVIVKIRDVTTDKVLTELPAQAVQAADKTLREYAEFLARHRAMSQTSGSAPTGKA